MTQLFVLTPLASLFTVVLNPESAANIERLSIPPTADKGGIGCSNGMLAQLDSGSDCKPMAATLNMLDAPSRIREAARFVPFYIAIVPILLLCLIGSFVYVRHVKKAEIDGNHGRFDCTGVFDASLLTFKVFDLMSDWGMNTISLDSFRFTELGKMGSGMGSGNFKQLQTASTFFCICGTVLFLFDTAAYLKTLSFQNESNSRKIRWKTLGAVVTLEDFPQIIICAIYLNSVGVDVRKDQLAIVSLVFSLISLVYNVVSVWYTYQKAQVPDAPKPLTPSFAVTTNAAFVGVDVDESSTESEGHPGMRARSNTYTTGTLQRDRSGTLQLHASQGGVAYTVPVENTPASTAPVTKQSPAESGSRCRKCNAKKAFCTCNVRRNTADMARPNVKVKSKKGKTNSKTDAHKSKPKKVEVVEMKGVAGFAPLYSVGKPCIITGVGSGVIRFVGLHAEKKESTIGVEMNKPKGKNNGTVNGYKYFKCNDAHGLLTHPSKVTISGATGSETAGFTVRGNATKLVLDDSGC